MTSSLVKDFDIMCDVLLRVHALSQWAWRNGKYLSGNALKRNTVETYERLKASKDPLTFEELEKLIRCSQQKNNRLLYFRTRFYLPPLEENSEFVAVLSLDSDLTEPDQSISFRVEMYRLANATGGGIMRAVGFRFEMGQHGSKHNYYHVQFTTERHDKEGRTLLPDCPAWMPTSEPCIIVPARSPVSLVFCILVGYCGNIKRVTRLISELNIGNRHKEIMQYLTI
jgi:hypothetical protein